MCRYRARGAVEIESDLPARGECNRRQSGGSQDSGDETKRVALAQVEREVDAPHGGAVYQTARGRDLAAK
jgi:hypothetical protein